jgi:hypothetical protein
VHELDNLLLCGSIVPRGQRIGLGEGARTEGKACSQRQQGSENDTSMELHSEIS